METKTLKISITKNINSFRFAARSFFNLNTRRRWYLINLYFWTITIE